MKHKAHVPGKRWDISLRRQLEEYLPSNHLNQIKNNFFWGGGEMDMKRLAEGKGKRMKEKGKRDEEGGGWRVLAHSHFWEGRGGIFHSNPVCMDGIRHGSSFLVEGFLS